MRSRLVRRLVLGLLALLLLPVAVVCVLLGLHWLGEVPDAHALNADLGRATRSLAPDITWSRTDRAAPRAFTCCGDRGPSASATGTSALAPAPAADRVVADLTAAGWSVGPEVPGTAAGRWLSARRTTGGPRVDVTVYVETEDFLLLDDGVPTGATVVSLTVR